MRPVVGISEVPVPFMTSKGARFRVGFSISFLKKDESRRSDGQTFLISMLFITNLGRISN